MSPDADINLTCRQCGNHFVFTRGEQEFYERKGLTSPSRCQECRSTRQNQPHNLVCYQCGTELDKEALAYCTVCHTSVLRDCELKTGQSQRAASAAHTKLLAMESQKAELAESVRRKEREVAELELKINGLNQDLDKAHQFVAALGSLEPALGSMGERLEALEQAYNKINDRMLQMVEKMHELHETTGLLEIIKRSLRNYQRQGT